MVEHRGSLRTPLLGAAAVAAVFVVLQATRVLTAQDVFQPAGGTSGAQFLFWGVLLAFAGFILLLSWRLGLRWAALRGPAGIIGLMAAGVHVLSWCAVGILVGLESATGELSGSAWMAALVVLAASALVFAGACISFLRPSAAAISAKTTA